MVRLIYNCVKRVIISLRFSILSIFVSLFAAGILLLIAINYYESSKTLLQIAERLMRETSQSLNADFTHEINDAVKDDALSANLIKHGLLNTNSEKEMVKYTYDLANRFNIVQSAFWGDEKGNYVMAEYDTDDSLTTHILDRTKNPPMREIFYRDLAGKVIKKTLARDIDFDPRKRPWYNQAAQEKKLIWTDIYIYEPSRYLGITIASPVFYPDGKLRGVFGLDIRLDWLSWYAGEKKVSQNGVVFIVTDAGKLIAFPHLESLQKPLPKGKGLELIDVHHISQPWVSKSFDIYQATGKKEFSFDYNGETYLAVYNDIPDIAIKDWLIAVVIPKDDFIGDLKKTSLITAGIGLLILALGLIFISSLVTRVVKPIKKAVKQMDKIKNFDLTEEEPIHSRIKEVIMLSSAMQAVRSGLKSFKKYVPASLVRQLIKTGEDARIGGTKKTLTIFFSDIESFTTQAENVEPNAFMEHVCEYLNELSKIVTEEKGTIDKYIGDSIMAFWGAPLQVDHPDVRAAHAALKCIQRLKVLGIKWAQENKPLFRTRIGLHRGDAIVGNVGSAERLNYTALGDAINTASRLENINILYGTQIMVSAALYQIIKDQFVLRKVDCVALKGKSISMDIYELLAERSDELTFDIHSYQKTFENAFALYQTQQWDAAIKDFERCLQIYREDTVAPVFIKRCQHFKMTPPKNWDGVWKS